MVLTVKPRVECDGITTQVSPSQTKNQAQAQRPFSIRISRPPTDLLSWRGAPVNSRRAKPPSSLIPRQPQKSPHPLGSRHTTDQQLNELAQMHPRNQSLLPVTPG